MPIKALFQKQIFFLNHFFTRRAIVVNDCDVEPTWVTPVFLKMFKSFFAFQNYLKTYLATLPLVHILVFLPIKNLNWVKNRFMLLRLFEMIKMMECC